MIDKKYKTYVTANLSIKEKDPEESLSSLDDIVKEKIIDIIPNTVRDKQLDLFYIETIHVSTGGNKNDDVFLPSELLKSLDTIALKPINLEHNKKDIIGVMYDSAIVNEDFQIITDEQIAELMEKDGESAFFHILSSGALYKFVNPELMQDIIDGAARGSKFVSMECYFDDFDFLYGDNIIEFSEGTSFLMQHLRAFGGTGEYNDKPVKRVLRDILFSGQGIVDSPANPHSFILSVASNDYIEVDMPTMRPIAIDNKIITVANRKPESELDKDGFDIPAFIEYDSDYYRWVQRSHLGENGLAAWIDSSGTVLDILGNECATESGKLYSDTKAKYLLCASRDVFKEYNISEASNIIVDVSDKNIKSYLENGEIGVYTDETINNDKVDIQEESIMDIEKLKADLAKATEEISTLKNSERNKELEALKASMEEKDAVIEQLNQKVTEVEAGKTEVETSLEEATKKATELEESTQKLTEEKEAVVAELDKIAQEKVQIERMAAIDKYDANEKQLELIKAEVADIDHKDEEAFSSYLTKLDVLLPIKSEDGPDEEEEEVKEEDADESADNADETDDVEVSENTDETEDAEKAEAAAKELEDTKTDVEDADKEVADAGTEEKSVIASDVIYQRRNRK